MLVEYEINNAGFRSFDEFAALAPTADLEFTAKCIAKIWSYDIVELTRLFGMLPERRRSRILELTIREGRYGGDVFREKIDLLRACCSRDCRIVHAPTRPSL